MRPLIRFLLWIGPILWFNASIAQPYNCPPDEPFCPYVYRIEIYDVGKRGDSPIVMTGFKIKDKEYLLTALHGIVDAVAASNGLSRIAIYALQNKAGIPDGFDQRSKMELCGFDKEKDLAYVCFDKGPKPELSSGIALAGKLTAIKEDDLFTLYGFHTGQIQVKSVTPDKTAFRTLKTVLNLTDVQAKWMQSPNPGQNVMVLSSHDVNGGSSGGPVIWSNKGLSAIGNGGRLTTIRTSGSGANSEQIDQTLSWAILLSAQDSKLKAPIRGKNIHSKFDALAKQILESHQNVGYKPLYAGHSQKLPASPNEGGTTLAYPNVKPSFVIGGTLSWTYLLKPTGLTLRQRPGDQNTFLDIYVERRIFPWLYVGAYGASPYLQYELLRQFDNNLPLHPDAIRTSAKGLFRYAGGQFSLVASGAFWQYYLGAGGLPIQIGKVRSNYRAYAGLRHYLFARRWLALEGRIVYIKPDEPIQLLRPRLGNALATDESKNLLNLNVCAGICIAL